VPTVAACDANMISSWHDVWQVCHRQIPLRCWNKSETQNQFCK